MRSTIAASTTDAGGNRTGTTRPGVCRAPALVAQQGLFESTSTTKAAGQTHEGEFASERANHPAKDL